MPQLLKAFTNWARAVFQMIIGLTVIILCITTNGLAQIERKSETADEVKHRFRNSLKRLKWDAKKQRAVEKDKPGRKEPNTNKTDNQETIRIKTELVVNEVMVLDTKGQIVSGLQQDDFIITENQVKESMEIFSPSSDPNRKISIILILDLSDSLEIRFPETLLAAQQLIAVLGAQDQMAIANDDVELLTDFTSDKNNLRNIISGYQQMLQAGQRWSNEGNLQGGDGKQLDTLMATLRELVAHDKGSTIIIYQTDGLQITGLKNKICGWPNFAKWRETVYSKEDIIEELQRSSVRLYPVITDDKFIGVSEVEAYRLLEEERNWWEKTRNNRGGAVPSIQQIKKDKMAQCMFKTQELMMQMAEVSGGWATYLNQPEPVKVVYERILAEARQRYILGYYPTNMSTDGKFREVKVTVKNHPEYIVKGRKGYFPQAE